MTIFIHEIYTYNAGFIYCIYLCYFHHCVQVPVKSFEFFICVNFRCIFLIKTVVFLSFYTDACVLVYSTVFSGHVWQILRVMSLQVTMIMVVMNDFEDDDTTRYHQQSKF
jgi:hypothetical protein